MFKPIFRLLIVFSLIPACIHGQGVQYKTYNNGKYKFTFNIPVNWNIKYSKEQEGVICVPATKKELESYKDCFEGIVFRMDFFDYGLDSTLSEEGYTKTGDTYYTTDRVSQSVKTRKLKGTNWAGIYHNNVCGISCSGNGFHAAAGRCEFLYFSNDTCTVCINTNGRQFDDIVLKELIKSFKFYEK